MVLDKSLLNGKNNKQTPLSNKLKTIQHFEAIYQKFKKWHKAKKNWFMAYKVIFFGSKFYKWTQSF